MKPFVLPFLCVLAAFASAAVVSPEEAVETARGYGAYVGGDALEGRFSGELEEPFTVEADLDGQSVVLAYGFNFTRDGWILVAADDRIDPIAGFSHSGRIVKADFEEEASPVRAFVTESLLASFRAFEEFERMPAPVASGADAQVGDSLRASVAAGIEVSRAKRAMYRAAAPDGSRKTPAPPAMDSVSEVCVPTLMTTKWAQSGHGESSFTDTLVSNSRSGCTQTAMGQIFYYLHWPVTAPGKYRIYRGDIYDSNETRVTYTTPVLVGGNTYSGNLYTRGGDGNGGAYRWDLMYVNSGSPTTEQKEALGALLWDIGIVNGAQYVPGSTAANPYPNALMKVFGYSNIRWTQVGGDKGSGIGVQTEAQKKAWFNAVHANLDAKIPVMLSGASSGSGHATVADGYGYIGADPYYHVNFGWGGSSDGYYQWDAWGGYSSAFVVFNVFTNFTGEIVSGRITYPNGSPAPNATVSLSYAGGSRSVKTDAYGIWAAPGVPSSTSITVSPSLPGYTFTPRTVSTGSSTCMTPSYSVSCGNVAGVDFTAVSASHAIVSGTVTINGVPFGGATVRFGNLTTTTSVSGRYGFEVAPGTSGTVSVEGYPNVSPASATVSGTVAGLEYVHDFAVSVSLGEAVDQPTWTFDTSSDFPWTVAFDQKRTMVSAVSAGLGMNGISLSSTSRLSVSLVGPGTLTFKMLLQTSGSDGHGGKGLRYWLDEGPTNWIDGVESTRGTEGIWYFGPDPKGWLSYTVNVPSGTHVMNWQMGPFFMSSSGLENKAWLDEIAWEQESSAVAPAGTVSVGSVTASSATATLALTNMGKNASGGTESSVTATFRYGTSPDLSGASTQTKTFTGTGSQTIPLTGLTEGTTYYYAATYAATKSMTTTTGSFTPVSLAQAPAGTVSVGSITASSAMVTLSLTNMGKNASGGTESSVTATFLYGTSPDLSGASTQTKTFTGTGSQTISLTGLTEGTTYYYAATYAATKSMTTTTGSFTPVSLAQAPAGTVSVGSVTASSATATLSLTNMGKNASGGTESSVTATFRYGTSPDLSGASTQTKTFTGTGSQTIFLTGLTEGTTYYYAATYAATKSMTTDAASFTTLTVSAPVLGTPVATLLSTNGTAATLSIDVTAVATTPATLTLSLNGSSVKTWDVAAPGTFSFEAATVPFSTNTFVFTASAAGKTSTKTGSFVARVYADWFTVRFTGVGEKEDDGGAWTLPTEGTAEIVRTNGVFAYALDGVDLLRYEPSRPSEAGQGVEVSGTILVSPGSSDPVPPANARIGFAFSGTSTVSVRGYGASGWTALSGAPELTKGTWVSYRIAYDFDARTATVSIGGTELAPALPLPAGLDCISGVGFVGTGAAGDFRGRGWQSESPVIPIVLPDHVDFTTDGTGIVLSDTTFTLNIADPVKGATYTVLTNATLTGHFAPACWQTVDADLTVLPLAVPVDPAQPSLFAKVVATIGPYEE